MFRVMKTNEVTNADEHIHRGSRGWLYASRRLIAACCCCCDRSSADGFHWKPQIQNVWNVRLCASIGLELCTMASRREAEEGVQGVYLFSEHDA